MGLFFFLSFELGAKAGKRRFFFTLGPTPELQNRNTLFARVAAGDTLFNLLKLNEIELDESGERPVYPPVIKSVVVIDNPFTDIVPRITGKERREQERNRVERREERRKKKESGGRRAVKYVFSSSFFLFISLSLLHGS